MKNSFLVHIFLPETFDMNFYSLIPSQRKIVNDLMSERVIKSYSLDMNRKNVWTILEADNELAVMDILSTFPIIKYVQVTIHELAFYDMAQLSMPYLIMN